MTDRPLSGMSIITSPDGTERILCQGADGAVLLLSGITTYVIDTLTASTEKTPTAGDALLMERSGTEGTFDIDDLSAYVVATGWGVATEADPAVSGDMILANRSGTVYELDVDTIQDYVLSGVQADVLDLSGLDAATLAGTDLFAVCQTTTGKKVTLTNLETKLWTDFQAYVEGLTQVATSAASDVYYTIQGSTPKYVEADEMAAYFDTAIIALGNVQTSSLAALPAHVTGLDEITSPTTTDDLYIERGSSSYKITLGSLADYALDASANFPWSLVSATKYTATPASTSTITMSDLTDFSIGDPVRFAQSGTNYYAVVTNKNASTLTIAGAPLSTGTTLQSLYVGSPNQLCTKRVFIESLFADTVYDMLSAIGQYMQWDGPPAFLVAFSVTAGEADSGASQPKVNVKVDSALVSTENTNKGPSTSATPGTWVDNSAVAIDTTNYAVTNGDAIEIRCTETGTNLDAADLTINLLFVYE